MKKIHTWQQWKGSGIFGASAIIGDGGLEYLYVSELEGHFLSKWSLYVFKPGTCCRMRTGLRKPGCIYDIAPVDEAIVHLHGRTGSVTGRRACEHPGQKWIWLAPKELTGGRGSLERKFSEELLWPNPDKFVEKFFGVTDPAGLITKLDELRRCQQMP